jgi:ubiquinone/menaquinone biosynthesis C-methylase UbiE
MRIPHFNTEEGSILYQNTVGRLISPLVAKILLAHAQARIASFTARKVLELGCGPGTLSLPLAREHPELDLVATDASAAMVALAETEAARQSLVNVHFRRMDADHIELEPESFDLVLCNLAFPFSRCQNASGHTPPARGSARGPSCRH